VTFRQSFEQQRVSFSKSASIKPLVKAFAAVCTQTCASGRRLVPKQSRLHHTEARRKPKPRKGPPGSDFLRHRFCLSVCAVKKSPCRKTPSLPLPQNENPTAARRAGPSSSCRRGWPRPWPVPAGCRHPACQKCCAGWIFITSSLVPMMRPIRGWSGLPRP
jgi:hypothetical protein